MEQGQRLHQNRARIRACATRRCLTLGSRLFLLLLCTLCTPAIATLPVQSVPLLTEREVLNRPVIARWTMEEGLPHNLVHGLVQDRDGMIWVATWEGVARFDGRTFTSFDRQNTPGMELSSVFSVVAESDGSVLVGTAYNGVFRYVAGRWQHLGDARAQRLRAEFILRDADGAVWVGNEDGLFRIERDGRLIDVGTRAGLRNIKVVCLLQDGDGLLVGTSQGLFRLASATASAYRWGSTAMQTASIRNLARDRNGGLLIATEVGLFWRSAGGDVQWLQRGERVVAALQDQENQLWMTLSNGQLLRVLPGGGNAQVLSISGVFGATLIEDREGLIWAGSSDGLYRVAKGDAGGLTRRDGLGSDYVRVVRQSADGAIWIGHAAGLDLWQHGRIRALRIGDRPGRDPAALALAPTKDGGMWVGTDSQGVVLLSADGSIRQRLGVEAGVPKTMVRAVLPDADGGLWIGSNDGLLYRKGAYMRAYGTADGLPGSHVQTLYRDHVGVLWIGTNQGIATMSADGVLKGIPSGSGFQAQNAFDFLEDPDGTLWIASDHGLLRRSGGLFHLYDHRVGLPRDKLFRLIDDKRGNIWATSNLGVLRIPRADLGQLDAGQRTKLVVDVLDRSDGMPGSQVNGSSAPAGWRSRDGTLLIPTSAGLGLIDPTLPGLRSVRPPPLMIESLQVNGKPLALHRNYILHGSVARLAIRYAGLSFRSPDKVRYRYRLYGFDRQWIDAGSNEEAVYTNLPPGDYRMEVQAIISPLDWSRSERIGSVSFPLQLVPPFWQRWPFVLFASMSVTGLLLWWYHGRTYRHRRRQRRLNAIIADRTHELRANNMALTAANRERDELVRKLAYQAGHDALTGLPNRHTAEPYLTAALEQAMAASTTLCVALLDIDYFKKINDAYGHEIGDEVLRRVGDLLRVALGDNAFAARHGGEEFLLVLPGLDREQALACLDTLRGRFAALTLQDEDGCVVQFTASIGFACLSPTLRTRRDLLLQADKHLYQAKHEGRDRVIG
ncbi:diguanylate cyclase [Xanthomonas albilineans]|uniref:diguanylate cyclase n=1 Tax=Xanthomonas albilineans (strain GPE PC73 / CFBP 7063) TaxID=380358 RepID=D2UC34_XANAP|nr:hypothetical two-component system sensor-response regulator hybrid protein [Xanthomonas albilineans GPE PC73]